MTLIKRKNKFPAVAGLDQEFNNLIDQLRHKDNLYSKEEISNFLADIETGAAFIYVAYADDISGTGFTLTFDTNKNFIAIKSTTIAIESPAASDFTGLWKKYKGEDGTDGTNGQGVPAGGTATQVLTKVDGTDFNTQWSNPSGGASTLDELTDVDTTGVTNGQTLIYDTSTNTWKPGTIISMAALVAINLYSVGIIQVTPLSNLSAITTLSAS